MCLNNCDQVVIDISVTIWHKFGERLVKENVGEDSDNLVGLYIRIVTLGRQVLVSIATKRKLV